MPDEPPLWDDAPPGNPFSGGRPSAVGGLSPGSKIAGKHLRQPPRLEENFLRQCLEYPGALHHVNRILSQNRQPEVSATDFARAEDRGLFLEIAHRAQPNQPEVATIAELCDSLDAVLAERVRSLMALPPSPETKLDRLPDTLALSVLDWRLEKIREHNTVLKQLLIAENLTGPDEDYLARLYGDQLQTSQAAMRRIDQARHAMSAMGRRRADERARRAR